MALKPLNATAGTETIVAPALKARAAKEEAAAAAAARRSALDNSLVVGPVVKEIR